MELTRWTARLAFVLYCGALLDVRHSWRTRIWWTLGCATLLVHIAVSFALVHGWSHAEAYRHTAEATRRLVGVDSGAGVYVNYAFALVWLADAAWWWVAEKSYLNRPRPIHAAVHGLFAFMFVQASIVFAPSPARWFAAALLGLCAATWLRRLIVNRRPRRAESKRLRSPPL